MIEFCFWMSNNMQMSGDLRGPLVIGGSRGAPAGASAGPVPFPPVPLGAYAEAGLDLPRRRLPQSRRRLFFDVLGAAQCASAGIRADGA
jgi:hypothetical protein